MDERPLSQGNSATSVSQLTRNLSRADGEDFLSSSLPGPKGDAVNAEKSVIKLTWIHLRYFPPALILQSINGSTKEEGQQVIDLLTFDHTSNLETTAQKLMETEKLLTRHNLPTLLKCLQKLRRRCVPDAGKQFVLRRSIMTHSMPILCACFARDGSKFATASYDKSCKIWNPSTGEEIASLGGHFDAVHNCIFNLAGDKVLTGSYDSTVRLFDLSGIGKEKLPVQSFHGAKGEIEAIDLSSEGHLAASGAMDCIARIYDLAKGETICTLEGHRESVNHVNFDPYAKTLLTGSFDGRLGIWDLRTGEAIKFLEAHDSEVMATSFDFMGQKVVSCSLDKLVNVWDLRNTTQPMAVLTDNTDEVWTVKFNSRCQLVASGAKDGRLIVWDIQNGKVLANHEEAHDSPIHHLTFSPSGNQLITCSEDVMAKIWIPDEGHWGQGQEVGEHGDKILYAGFSYLGDRLLTVAADNLAYVWE